MRRLVIIPGKQLWRLAAILVVVVMGCLLGSVVWQGSSAVVGYLGDRHVVVLDPGHGGYDPGAITSHGVYEKDLTLQVAQRVKELLDPSGIKIVLTRDEDEDYVPSGVKGKGTKKQIDLNQRILLASQAGGDVLVSLHVNSVAKGDNSGAETFYHYSSASGKRLAEAIQRELAKVPGMNRRVAKPADFYIIRNTAMPAVIVELGYLSNTVEQKKLQQAWYQDQLARAVAKGIISYFGLP